MNNDVTEKAARELADATGISSYDAAIVLGSGWAPAAAALGSADAEVPFSELAGFAPPSVAGHVGVARSVQVAGRRVLVLLGRTHVYEGHGVDAAVHGVRVAIAAGA